MQNRRSRKNPPVLSQTPADPTLSRSSSASSLGRHSFKDGGCFFTDSTSTSSVSNASERAFGVHPAQLLFDRIPQEEAQRNENSPLSGFFTASGIREGVSMQEDGVVETSYGDVGSENERMTIPMLDDPRNLIINMIIHSSHGSVQLQSIYKHLDWENSYEKKYGTVGEYLQGYHSIFVVSPIYDRVTLCRPVIASLQKTNRRRHRSQKQSEEELVAAHIGSISCSCVAETIVIEDLLAVYRRRGFDADIRHNVLQVQCKNVFDLFIFENGVIVWWGMNRRDHWIVEDDFFSADQGPVLPALRSPFASEDIHALFPNWCSYEVDESYLPLKVDDKVSERFSKMLCFDHYRVPSVEPDRSDVMLTVSYCIGRSACIDYYEHVTQFLHKSLSVPIDFTGIIDYFASRKMVGRLEGELQVTHMALMALNDTPDFLWEMPWLQAFYDLTELQCTAQLRLSWFAARGDALLEKISSIKNRRHRLFMLASDVFLILLLVFDVFCLTTRLVVNLYFKAHEYR